VVAQLPNQVITEMAQRSQRLHHWLFHMVRNNWLFYDTETQNILRDLGWEPPRPAIRSDSTRPSGWSPILDNFSGEDFLYMHREMIRNVNQILIQAQDPQYPKIEGWEQIPRIDDVDYPVPPSWIPNVEQIKSNDAFQNYFIPLERRFTDPNYLSTITLGRMGAEIEFSIHNSMHIRWASEPSGNRPEVDATNPELIDTIWDHPSYDFLGDTYSSHVNPIFWKLHGWIDKRIEDWKNAHGITGEIQWTGTWVGHMHGHETPPLMLKELSVPKKDQDANLLKVLKGIEGKNKINDLPIINPFS
jgi:hypothetical protein